MSDPVSNKSGREALRGAEVDTLDLIFEVLTSQQLAELLKALLVCRRQVQQRPRTQACGAGAGIGDARHEAIRGRHGEIVSGLVESGASVVAKDGYGCTPLHVAARRGETEIAQLWWLKGANKDAFDNEGNTPLYHAVCREKWDTARVLLAAGADVNLRCGHFKTPVIHMAARRGNVEMLRAVIEHGADVDAVDGVQRTALHLAWRFNEIDAIHMLLGAGANIEAQDHLGRTPLHVASYKLSHEALLSLLKHGAPVDAQDYSRQTPLMLAAFACRAGAQAAAVVDPLLRAGADETMVDQAGRAASDMIRGDGEDAERVRELLANAPADRAWHRRGYLVLCRAHPDRVRQELAIDSTHHDNVARRASSRARIAGAGEASGDNTEDKGTGGDWAVVVSKVLRLQEEGIFRMIVGSL